MRVIPCLLAMLALAAAQDLTPLKNEIAALAAATEKDRDTALANLTSNLSKAMLTDAAKSGGTPAEAKKTVQEILLLRRADTQSGASSAASGSTSAVQSPLLPAIFGVGIENGGITRSVAGTTITLKANPAELFCAAGPSAAAVARRDDEVCKTFWKRLGLTASFDTARGEKDSALAPFRALNNQFTEFTARFEIVNHRKVTGARFEQIFAPELRKWQTAAQKFANANAVDNVVLRAASAEVVEQFQLLEKTPTWKVMTAERKGDAIGEIVVKALAKIRPDLKELDKERKLWLDALRADRALQNRVANAAALTFEYSYQQPDLAKEAIGNVVPKGLRPPNLHSARLIFARGWTDRGLDFTANASGSWFSDTRPGMRGNFRDFRGGVEGKFKLGEIRNYGVPTLSFAGLYVFLNQEPLGLGIVAFNQAKIKERGHIGLFQTKLEFPTGNNAVRIPISFTYSNRTELIKESDVRGQIGISFNLDALLAQSKGK